MKSRKDLINFSLEKNTFDLDKNHTNKNDYKVAEDPKPNIENHLFNKYRNFAHDLKKNASKTNILKNNNSAADLHCMKRNLNRRDFTINHSLHFNSPKEENNLTKIRTNSKFVNNSPKPNNYSSSILKKNLYTNQNELRKEHNLIKKNSSLVQTQSIDYSIPIYDSKKMQNKEILKSQKNNRNCNQTLHSPTDKAKDNFLLNKINNFSVKNSSLKNINSSYATIDSNKSSFNFLTTEINSKPKESHKDNNAYIHPSKSSNKKNLNYDSHYVFDRSINKFKDKTNISPKIKKEDKTKIYESGTYDLKNNKNTQNHNSADANYKTNHLGTSKISLDKNYTIERLKNKIYKKFTNFNQSSGATKIQNEKKIIKDDKKGTIINISNNINNNFHILINQPNISSNKLNGNSEHPNPKISTHPDNNTKISLGDNLLLKSNIKYKSNLSSFKELTNITQKFKNFHPGNISFSKLTEMKKPNVKINKQDGLNQNTRLKSEYGESICSDNKYDEEFENILMKNEFNEKENSSKLKREDLEDNYQGSNHHQLTKNKFKNISDKNSVSEEMFNIYINKNLHDKENIDKNNRKNVILTNKEYYSSSESNKIKQGNAKVNKQSESGSLLSDESIFEISRLKKKIEKKLKNNNDSSLKRLSQSLKISSESNEKKSSISKEKSSSNKDLLEASLSYNVSDEDEFEVHGSKNSLSKRKNQSEFDQDDFKKFYEEMNKKLYSYK